MAEKTIQLYSVTQGKKTAWHVEVDPNGEILATNTVDKNEFLKFPAGLDRKQLDTLIAKHNKANEGIVARDPEEVEAEQAAIDKSHKLIDSL
jgi:hypothetical protein